MAKHERKPHFRNEGVRHATINGHRFHLRMAQSSDQQNLLWIDGRQPPLILDQTAADFIALSIEAMWRFQQGEGDESDQVRAHVVDQMFAKYGRPLALGQRRVTRRRLCADLDRIYGTLMSFAEGACPMEIGLEQREIHFASWNAPARMDLAVTYRCNLSCSKCYVGDRQLPELPLSKWCEIYEILWRLGIPQVVFTGGEPLQHDDILELISQADEFVTGLVTNGTWLYHLAEDLVAASLDYVQVTIESRDAGIHNQMVGEMVPGESPHQQTLAGIEKALELGIQVVTNTTLTRLNGPEFPTMLRWLHTVGIKHVACNRLICSGRGVACRETSDLPDGELCKILEDACLVADKLGMDLQWYSPGCYTLGLNPLTLGFGAKACSAAAHNMTIQPDGTVLPCQSWPNSVGNILLDPWRIIWDHPVCQKLRKHAMAAETCRTCLWFEACGGGCPLDNTVRRPERKQS